MCTTFPECIASSAYLVVCLELGSLVFFDLKCENVTYKFCPLLTHVLLNSGSYCAMTGTQLTATHYQSLNL